MLRNDGGNGKPWLQVQPRLAGGKTDAIGARVTVASGTTRQVRHVVGVMGYLSQSDLRAHFGLGTERMLEDVVVRWPGGTKEAFGSFESGQTHLLHRGAGTVMD